MTSLETFEELCWPVQAVHVVHSTVCLVKACRLCSLVGNHLRVVMKSHRWSHQPHVGASGSAILRRTRGMASFQPVFSCFCTGVLFVSQYITGEKDMGNKKQVTKAHPNKGSSLCSVFRTLALPSGPKLVH